MMDNNNNNNNIDDNEESKEFPASKPMPYPQLIDEISRHCDVRADIVREVMNAFVDIAIDEVINRGRFTIPKFFRVKSYLHNGTEVTTLGLNDIPKRYRVSVSLSGTLRYMIKKTQDNPGLKIDRYNWREYWRKTAKNRSHQKRTGRDERDVLDEFLYDEDDDY